jgi:hypothetical protein
MTALDRARAAIGRPTIYALGRGGRDPLAQHPADENRRCDCSGFVAWVLGTPRRVPDTIGWIETSRIVRDATVEGKLFHRLASPVAGDLVGYGDYTDEATGLRRQGHVGILSVVSADVAGAASWWDDLRVIHCSVTNSRRGDAIAETNARAFRRRGIFMRWHGGRDLAA